MKTLKAICTATLLALVLSVSAMAGEIGTPGAPKPAGDTSSSVITILDPNADQDSDSTSASGEIGTPGFGEVIDALLFMIY